MSSRPSSSMHGYGHHGHGKKFTSSGVSAEYKAALSVFNNAMLTETCKLLQKRTNENAPAKKDDNGASQIENKASDGFSDPLVQTKYQSMYNRCTAACNTITKTEAMPGFLKKHHMGMQKGMAGMGPAAHRMNMNKSAMSKGVGMGLLRRPSTSLQARGSSSQGPAQQYSRGSAAGSMHLKSLKYRVAPMSAAGGTTSSSAGFKKPFPPPPATNAEISNSNHARKRSATPPPKIAADRNAAPPKSALKFLEALNKNPSLGHGPSKGGSGSDLRKNEVQSTTTTTKKKRRHSTLKKVDYVEEKESVSEAGNKESSDDDQNMSDGAREDDSSSSSSDGGKRKTRASRRARQNDNDNSSSTTVDDDGKRRSSRTRTRTDAYAPEEGKVKEKKSKKNPPASPPPPSKPNSEKKTGKKVNAPKKPSGQIFEVGDEILVYHAPDDKWYESIVSNINYGNEMKQSAHHEENTSSSVQSRRRSSRNRSKNADANEELEIVSYDVEYDNGEHEENVIPLNVVSRFVQS